MSSPAATAGRPQAHAQAGPGVIVIGVLMAVWCIGFAVINLVFEVTGHLADGPYARYTSVFAVMNWVVVGLKVLGAAVALLSVANRPRFASTAVMTTLVWGAFAMLGVYVLGSVVEAIGMVSGLVGNADQVDLAGIGYVLFFLVAAAGYGVLATSYSRRHGFRKRFAVLGVLGAPVMLFLILLTIPSLLAALGFVPAY